MFARLYWVIPLFGTLVWLSMLMAMIIYWAVASNKIVYAAEARNAGQTIPYISDVGAYTLRPLFIAMAAVSVVCLDAALIAERWLRHNGRLAPNTSFFQKFLSVISIITSIIGALGIILLAIYDTAQYPRLHDIFLGLFIGGYVLSAVFICWEYQRLGIHFRQHAVLRTSFWFKLFFILIEICLAIAFGVSERYGAYNVSAVFEWLLAFIFTFYIATFVMDLLPAVKTKHHMSHAAVAEMNGQSGFNGYTNGNTGYGAQTSY